MNVASSLDTGIVVTSSRGLRKITKKDLFRYWKKVRKSDGCWDWTACRNKKGYGKFGLGKGVLFYAHRLSFLFAFGFLNDDLMVCHHCDNPSCVRPDHLFQGTQKDNLQDMAKKGRSLKGDRNWTRINRHLMPRGEGHVTSKLKESEVIALRADYATGKFTFYDMASKYKVSYQNAHAIVSRKLWKHVP